MDYLKTMMTAMGQGWPVLVIAPTRGVAERLSEETGVPLLAGVDMPLIERLARGELPVALTYGDALDAALRSKFVVEIPLRGH